MRVTSYLFDCSTNVDDCSVLVPFPFFLFFSRILALVFLLLLLLLLISSFLFGINDAGSRGKSVKYATRACALFFL